MRFTGTWFENSRRLPTFCSSMCCYILLASVFPAGGSDTGEFRLTVQVILKVLLGLLTKLGKHFLKLEEQWSRRKAHWRTWIHVGVKINSLRHVWRTHGQKRMLMGQILSEQFTRNLERNENVIIGNVSSIIVFISKGAKERLKVEKTNKRWESVFLHWTGKWQYSEVQEHSSGNWSTV